MDSAADDGGELPTGLGASFTHGRMHGCLHTLGSESSSPSAGCVVLDRPGGVSLTPHTHGNTGREATEAFCVEHKRALANLAAGKEIPT